MRFFDLNKPHFNPIRSKFYHSPELNVIFQHPGYLRQVKSVRDTLYHKLDLIN